MAAQLLVKAMSFFIGAIALKGSQELLTYFYPDKKTNNLVFHLRDKNTGKTIELTQKDVEKLYYENQDLKKQIEKLIASNSALKEEVEALKERNNDLEGKVKALEESNTDLAEKVGNLEKENIEMKERTAGLEEKLKKTNGQLASLDDGFVHLKDDSSLTEKKEFQKMQYNMKSLQEKYLEMERKLNETSKIRDVLMLFQNTMIEHQKYQRLVLQGPDFDGVDLTQPPPSTLTFAHKSGEGYDESAHCPSPQFKQ